MIRMLLSRAARRAAALRLSRPGRAATVTCPWQTWSEQIRLVYPMAVMQPMAVGDRKNEQIPLFSVPAAGLAAMQRGNGHCYMESSFFPSRTRRGYMNRRPCPRVRPRGHITQRARGEIFKLSLDSFPVQLDPTPMIPKLIQNVNLSETE